jgi:hypothetical protein
MNELITRSLSRRSKRWCVPRHRCAINLIPNWAFWLLDSASIQRIAGDKQAAAARLQIIGQGGTF